MIAPSSFPATSLGYNAYVKALGFNPKDSNTSFWVISKAQFFAIDRRTLLERIVDNKKALLNKWALNYNSSDRQNPLYHNYLAMSCLESAIRTPELSVELLDLARAYCNSIPVCPAYEELDAYIVEVGLSIP